MSVNLAAYVPLPEVIRRYRIRESDLLQMVDKGIIRAVKVDGAIAIAEEDLDKVVERKDFENLRGKSILASEAARKYGIHSRTISRWAHKGLIRILGRSSRRLYLDEADVAYCAAVYRVVKETAGSTRGRRIFADGKSTERSA